MVVRVLTFSRAHPIPYASVGWTAARANAERWAREESPGSMDIRCRITSGGRKPRDSATENRPPRPSLATCEQGAVRVKRCGKSAPRLRQRRRHGKPHREQDRIGTARGSPLRERKRFSGSMSGSSRPGRLLKAPGNRRRRGMAVTRGASLALQNPAYRPADALQGGSAENRRAPANFGDRAPAISPPRYVPSLL